jgi:predicted cobalt transporter CbtA
MNPRSFLIHGLIAGLLGGLVAFVVALGVGEPAINDAIAEEESSAAAAHAAEHAEEGTSTEGHSHGDEEGGISRGQQAGPGLATATVLFGVVLGGVAGIGAAFAAGRFGRLSPVATTGLVVGLGFLSAVLVPWLKYPPNPPAVGSGDTIGERTALYFGFLAISVLAVIGALIIARRVLEDRSAWTASVTGGAFYLGLVGLATVLMAPIDEVPDSFPANTLVDFRVGSLLTQSALWLTIGVVLTGLVHRAWTARAAEAVRLEKAQAL